MVLREHDLLGKLRKWSRTHGVSERFYLVGGSVRNLLLGKSSSDIDVAVQGEALLLAQAFAEEIGARLVVLSKEFQTARVVQHGEHLDFSGLRAESLEEDLKARDFTIDAIALPLLAIDLHGQLIDPCNGLADLNNGVVRMIAEENLCDDPLRLLRAFRIKAVLGFSVDKETAQAIKRHARLIADIAGERIFTELKAILACSHSSSTVEAMAEAGLLSWMFFDHCSTCLSRASRQTAYSEVEIILNNLQDYFGDSSRIETYFFKAPEQRLLLKLAVLLHDTEKPEAWDAGAGDHSIIRNIAARLKASRRETAFLEQVVSNRPFVQQLLESQGHPDKTTLVRLIRQLSDDIYAIVVLNLSVIRSRTDLKEPHPMVKGSLQVAAQRLIDIYDQEILPRLNNPRLITGDDVMMEFAISPSPLIGEMLDKVDQAALEGRINTRQEAVELIRKTLSDKR